MTTNQRDPSSLADFDVLTLERLIGSGDVDDARTYLREYLFRRSSHSPEGSIGDALAVLASDPAGDREAGIVLLRALSIPELLPKPNTVNRIIPLVVAIVERALPSIVEFLRVDKKAQNHEKFAVLTRCHDRVCDILQPISNPYGDLEGLVGARKELIGALNHSVVRQYAGLYRLKETRSTIETVCASLRKVVSQETTLLTDVETCRRSIASAHNEANEDPSFLSTDFLKPFLSHADSVLSSFLIASRGRFNTDITWASPSPTEIQKRYPLHEADRKIRLAVPLHVTGPGMAVDIRASALTTADQAIVNSSTMILGNVLPGEFAVHTDVLIVEPSDSFDLLLAMEWGGNRCPSSAF